MEKYIKPIVSETELMVEEIIMESLFTKNDGELHFGEGDGETW